VIFRSYSINPSVPNLFVKKPGLVRVVPIISANRLASHSGLIHTQRRTAVRRYRTTLSKR
jgi:hypothetical protein